MSEAKIAIFLGSSKKNLKAFPKKVRSNIGHELHQAQTGLMPLSAKPLKGYGSTGVLEIIENFHGDTYRAVYTVKFLKCVYVLHCFQKKSKQGIATPLKEIELIKQRLKTAAEHYRSHYE